MNHITSFEIGENIKSRMSVKAADKRNSGDGAPALRMGQRITGTIVSVEDLVTIHLNGQTVTADKGLLGNVKVGDIKTFEVMKANEKEIELKLIDDFTESNKKVFKATRVKESDWETMMEKKQQEAKNTEKEAEYQKVKSKLDEITTKLTELDGRRLEQEGFPLEGFTITGLSEAIDRMKSDASKEINKATAKQNKRTGSIAGEGAQSQMNLASLPLQSFNEAAIATRLREENLPVTKDNISKITKALDLSKSVSLMDDKAMRHLIATGAKPSVGNIYKACYSSNSQRLEKITEEAWTSLEGQVKEVISEAGYEVNKENLDTARWLLENQLPITKETYSYKKDLEELKTHADMDTVLKQMFKGMKNGVLPTEASLISNPAKAEQIVTDINSIQPETITEAIKSNSELTIKKLASIQEALTGRAREPEVAESTEKTRAAVDAAEDRAVATDQGMEEEPSSVDKNPEVTAGGYGTVGEGYEEIRAKRQLEEIRLKMTLDAAAQLEKKGFSIETRQLEEVVDALRELEDNYYQRYFLEAGTEAIELSLQTLKDTTQSVEALKYLPNYILGSTLSLRSTQTIPGLLAEGSKLQSDLSRAGMAYETLMTLPNREYGDSIAKAFANMGSLLEELKIENTELNQRAVRILGYNRMEITQEAIEQVKAYDLQVNSLIQNLHPAVTVRIIKDGINPLETPIQDLNRIIDNMKEEQGITTQEKFSTYLRNLEKTEGLTDQERKAYIGIYRLLYNVEKSDGAALGAVIHSNREVTLENLLSAVQTMKKGRLDSVINDEFGLLQKTSGSSDTMAAQLSTFANKSGHNAEITTKEAAVKEQTQYLERILRQITEELSPEQLREAGKSISLSEAVWQQESAMATDTFPGIWETIKDSSVEKLYDYLKHTQQLQTEEEVYEQKVHQLRELGKNAEQSLRFLNDYRVPSTPMNVMLANHILSNGESPIKKLLQLQDENIVEKSENSLKDLTDLSDTLIDKHSMEEAYTGLERDAKAALHQAYSEERIDALKLAELKSIGQQLTFLRQLAEKEFYQIPIETAKGVTNMNLTIIRGSEASQKVMVTVWSEQLGNVKAEFTLKNETLKGFISSDSRIGLERLEKNADGIRQAAEENQLMLRQLDFGLQQKDNDNHSSHSIGAEDHSSPTRADTERTLYQLAKAIVRFVSDAEDDSAYAEDAV